MRSGAAVVLLSACLGSGACSGARSLVGTLGDLQEVQRKVVVATGHDNVRVHLANGRHLTVSVINSPLKQLPGEQKTRRAREIALIAYEALPSRSSLERVAVAFAVHRQYFLVFNYSDATDYHSYDVTELARAAGGGAAER